MVSKSVACWGGSDAAFTLTKPRLRLDFSMSFGRLKVPSWWLPIQLWSRSGPVQERGSGEARTGPDGPGLRFVHRIWLEFEILHESPSTQVWSAAGHARSFPTPLALWYGEPGTYGSAPR